MQRDDQSLPPLAAEGSQLTSDLPPAAAQTRCQCVYYLADVGKNDFCGGSAVAMLSVSALRQSASMLGGEGSGAEQDTPGTR